MHFFSKHSIVFVSDDKNVLDNTIDLIGRGELNKDSEIMAIMSLNQSKKRNKKPTSFFDFTGDDAVSKLNHLGFIPLSE